MSDPAIDAFIEAEVSAFGEYLLLLARDRVVARNINDSGELLKSLAVVTSGNTLQMSFLDSGRMHDMGAGNGYHKGKFMGSAERAKYLKGRKPSKWYSRLAWGAVYGTLANNIANKYVAEVPKMMVDAFNKA